MPDFSETETVALLDRAVTLALADPLREDEERWKVVCELHRRGGPTGYEAATGWCSSEDALIRALGADVLGQLGFGDGYPFADLCTPTLVHLLDDAEPAVVGSALVALGHLGKGEPARICPLASHPSAEVRHDVAFCLGRRKEDLALETLIRLSADEDADVRDWATFALGSLSEIDTPALRDALVARLNDADADVRGEAMRGLARCHDIRAVDAILAELQRPDRSGLAIEAAAAMPRTEIVPRLEALVGSVTPSEDLEAALEACRESKPRD